MKFRLLPELKMKHTADKDYNNSTDMTPAENIYGLNASPFFTVCVLIMCWTDATGALPRIGLKFIYAILKQKFILARRKRLN